jgi:hypothetical protein
MPANDPKKKAEAIEKAMSHARKGMIYIVAEIGGPRSGAGKEIATILAEFQKVEAAFRKAAKALPAGGKEVKTYADAVKGDMDGIRKAMMDIVVEVGTKSPPGKEVSKLLTDFQKLEGSFKTIAKSL